MRQGASYTSADATLSAEVHWLAGLATRGEARRGSFKWGVVEESVGCGWDLVQ